MAWASPGFHVIVPCSNVAFLPPSGVSVSSLVGDRACHPSRQLVPFVTDLAPHDIGTGPMTADGAAVKLLEAAAVGVCVLVARRKTELAIHPAQRVPFVTILPKMT